MTGRATDALFSAEGSAALDAFGLVPGLPPPWPLARLEACRVPDLSGTPVDPPGKNAPFVAGVELHPAGLVEVVEGKLAVDGGLVHCLQKRGGAGKTGLELSLSST